MTITKQPNGLYKLTETATGFSLDNLTEIDAYRIKLHWKDKQ